MPNVGFVRPDVTAKLPQWQKVADCVEGEECIKKAGATYLPVPETSKDNATNYARYNKYLLRAVFFPVTGRTLDGLIGQVFSKEIATDVPDNLEPLLEDIDGAGTSLEQQSKQALESVLSFGRAGLLSDFPEIPEDAVVTKADIEAGRYRPRVILYQPQQVINWREETIGGESRLSLLVLKEEAVIDDDGFEFETEDRWRVIRLAGGGEERGAYVQLWKKQSEKQGPESKGFVPVDEEAPMKGPDGKPLDRIPFTFIGATNNDVTVDESPLYPLACLNVAHYRNSADYEQSLFLVGQPTPVFAGLTDDWAKKYIHGKVTLGSSNAVALPTGSTFDLLQVAPNTMPMEGMTHKEDQMKAIGAKLIEPGGVERTATEAEIEEASEASILSSAAKNVSAAYEVALVNCSLFLQDPADLEDVSVALNSEFQVVGLGAQERQEVMAAWQGGIIAWQEVREIYRKKGIATLADDEAKELIAADDTTLGTQLPPAGG